MRQAIEELHLSGLCFKLLGNYNLQGFALCQAIGEFELVGHCFGPSTGGLQFRGSCPYVKWKNYNLQGLALRQAIVEYNFEAPVWCQAMWELQLAGFCFASSYCRIKLARLCSAQASEGLQYRGSLLSCVELLGSSNWQGLAFASGSWGIITCKVLFCPKLLRDYTLQGRFWFVIFLQHAKSVLDASPFM